MKQENEKYCTECGMVINIKAEICPKCGVRQPAIASSAISEPNGNRWISCLLLCFFLGPLGVHRFYTGHTAIGVVQLLTLGGCGIWVLVDFIMILTGSFKDSLGNVIKNS
jgi:TM2 domain-containing membrane protein YozV